MFLYLLLMFITLFFASMIILGSVAVLYRPADKVRTKTWYWSIWWWYGYHGLYQINWMIKGLISWLKKH